MWLAVLGADVGAFEWAVGRLDRCNFRCTFSQNGTMLHLVHFSRVFTKVPLSATSGILSKYVVDISTQSRKDAPSRSASRWRTPRVSWLSDRKIHSWADLWSHAPPSFDVVHSRQLCSTQFPWLFRWNFERGISVTFAWRPFDLNTENLFHPPKLVQMLSVFGGSILNKLTSLAPAMSHSLAPVRDAAHD